MEQPNEKNEPKIAEQNICFPDINNAAKTECRKNDERQQLLNRGLNKALNHFKKLRIHRKKNMPPSGDEYPERRQMRLC